MSYLTDCLESAIYVPKIKCRDKKDLLHNIAYLMLENQGFSKDFIENVFNIFLYREKLCTTDFGKGIAFPHARLDMLHINFLQLGFFTVDPPIDYDAIDNKPVFFIGAILVPDSKHYIDNYLEVLACLAELVLDKSVMSNITQLETPDQLKSHIINWTLTVPT